MWCAIYLCCLVVTGYPLTLGLSRGASKIEIAGLSVCMGTGVMGIVLIFLSMAGIRPAAAEIFVIAGIMALAAPVVRHFKKSETIVERGQSKVAPWWAVACFVAMGYGLLSVGIDAIHFPVI